MATRIVPIQLDDLTTDLARVRSVLLRELETINSYEELARQASNDEVKAFFLHLAKEEKEHVAEATLLLRRLDADQEAYFQKDYSAAHFAGQPPALTVDGLGPNPRPTVRTSSPSPAAAFPVSSSPRPSARGPATPKRGASSAQVDDLRLPSDPARVPYALPSPPSTFASELTVGTLRRKAP
ncbi:MAG: ferritin family protein [Myxococcaceae bacterium]